MEVRYPLQYKRHNHTDTARCVFVFCNLTKFVIFSHFDYKCVNFNLRQYFFLVYLCTLVYLIVIFRRMVVILKKTYIVRFHRFAGGSNFSKFAMQMCEPQPTSIFFPGLSVYFGVPYRNLSTYGINFEKKN